MSQKNNIVGFGSCDIQTKQEPRKSYQPSASADNSYLNHSGYNSKTLPITNFTPSYCYLLHYILHTVTEMLKYWGQNWQVI